MLPNVGPGEIEHKPALSLLPSLPRSLCLVRNKDPLPDQLGNITVNIVIIRKALTSVESQKC